MEGLELVRLESESDCVNWQGWVLQKYLDV
jgi:hypothetical protein